MRGSIWDRMGGWSRQRNARHMGALAGLLCAAGFGTCFGQGPAVVTLPNLTAAQTGSGGSNFQVPVQFASQGLSISGIQFDVTYDNAAMSLGASLSPAAQNSAKSLYYADVTPNRKRFLIAGITSGTSQNTITDGLLVNVVVTPTGSGVGGFYSLTASNALATDPGGHNTALSSVSGSATIGGAGSSVQILSGASFLSGPVAPGELVTLNGLGIGPAAGVVPASGVTSSALSGVSVLFDSTPAQLMYTGPNQINAIVPFGVYGKTSTVVSVQNGGQITAQATVAVAASAPGLFTSNSSGAGQGAILNQDTSMNTAANPAARGTIVSLFASGGGQTNPAGVDGQIVAVPLPTLLLLSSVSVQMGGINAQVLYAGPAPGLVAGVLQINCVVPASVTPGSSVPVVVTVGTASSQPGVTLGVQ